MKKYIISFALLICLIFPFKIFASNQTFIDFGDGLSGITLYDDNENAEERYKNQDFEFNDITNEVKSNTSLLNKINEYGTLLYAIDIDYKGTDNLDNAMAFVEYYFDYEEELYNNIGTLIKKEDEFVAIDNEWYEFYTEEYIQEYDIDEKYLNKIYCGYMPTELDITYYIIVPEKETYKIEQDNIKVTYDYFKYKNLTNNAFFFDKISNALKKDNSYNENYLKSIAASQGLDFDEIISLYDYDNILEGLIIDKDILEMQVNRTGKKLIDMYGMFFVDKENYYLNTLGNIYSSYDISIKIDEELKKYSDYDVYLTCTEDYVKLDTGVFDDSESTTYYRKYLSDEGVWTHVNLWGTFDENDYIYGDPIPPNIVLESAEDYGYRKPTSNKFITFYDDNYGYYYEETPGNYIKITDYTEEDLISDYEETNGVTVLIHDDFVLTEDTTFLYDKDYFFENEDENSYDWVYVYDYLIGSNIADYNGDIYIEAYSLEPVKTPVKIENGYINFVYKSDDYYETIPLIIISGKETKEYSKITSDNNYKISFREADGLTFDFFVDDFEKYTTALAQQELNKSTKTIAEMVKAIKNDLISDEVLNIYNITVKDSTDKKYTEGPFEFKIKKTKEMSNYKNLKLINISTDNSGNLIRKEIVELIDDGEYLSCTLPHLSVYALSGSKNGIPVEVISSENGSINNGNDSFTLTQDIGEYILCNIKDSKLTFYPQDKSESYEYNAIPNKNYVIDKWTYKIGNGEEIEIKDNTKIMKSNITDKIVFTAYYKKVLKPESNPKTYDNGITFIMNCLISFICLTLSILFLKKKKFN